MKANKTTKRMAFLASALIAQNGPQACDDAQCPNYGKPTNNDGTCPKVANEPKVANAQHLAFLDELRESGKTNMFGARPYLLAEFPYLTKADAAAILGEWMRTFGERHPS